LRNAPADSGLLNRYSVTKLLELLLVRELARHISPPPVITAVNPGFCYSDFMRDIKGFTRYFVAAVQSILARSTEVGSRTLVAGACAGSANHGKYMADGANQEPARWISTEEGARLQRRVYEQTVDMLERIEPGIGEIA
jgi:retinol dehydrogenase 12